MTFTRLIKGMISYLIDGIYIFIYPFITIKKPQEIFINVKTITKMRLNFLLVFIFLANVSFGQTINSNKVANDLLVNYESSDQEYFEVLIQLYDQVDLFQLDNELNRKKATPSERSERVITALEDKAAETQNPLLNFLNTSDKVVKSSIRSFWITNTIFAEVHRDVMVQLSRRDDVGWLFPNHQLGLVDAVGEVCYSPPSPNGREFGHTMIRANKLWQLGYTGYGSSAFVIDTGTDGEHPALRNNYKGNYYGDDASWTGNTSSPQDCDDAPGHGTHVTGTVAGLDRLTSDTIGVAFNALWMAAPPISCPGSFNSLGTFANFQWALNPDGNASTTDDRPDAINNSWSVRRFSDSGDVQFGAGECNSSYTAMINTLEIAGVAVIFSAGNQGDFGASSIGSPMLINTTGTNAFCVGAVNSGQVIAGFSSRGPSLCATDSMTLEIKPEVSAPGVNVRSSFPGGVYGSISGTSMAAPQVTGSVCLLKEAFPNLIGRDLLAALHITAVDKGTPGEDNAYGNGIIDLLAAYNYLVAQGNTPADPNVANDLMVVNLTASEIECAGNVTPVVTVENAGTEEVTSFEYEILFAGNFLTESWTGSIMPGARQEINLPFTSPVAAGAQTYNFDIVTVNGSDDEREFNGAASVDVIVSNQQPIVPFMESEGVICQNSSVSLRANPLQNAIFNWYDASTEGTLLGTGNALVVDATDQTESYYLETSFKVPAGLPDTAVLGTPEISVDISGELIFDAMATFTLKSVKVYADVPGPRVFKILNSDGTTIGQKLALIGSQGEHVIDMNVTIPQGEEYRMTLDSGNPLWYTKEGLNYPYAINEVVSIKRSSNVLAFNYYYYFYDWQVEFAQVCGRTAIDVVATSTDAAPTALFDASSTSIDLGVDNGQVSFTNTSTGGTSYEWNFGDGATSSDENPSYVFNQMGTYVVTLTALNADGCIDAFSQTIEVTGIVGLNELPDWADGLRIFPNPSEGNVFVDFNFNAPTNLQVYVTDLLGKRIKQINNQEYTSQRLSFDLTAYESGVYFFVFEGKDQVYTRKVVLMD